MHIDSYFEQQGEGSPIVFIHGSYATTATWKKIVEHLAHNNHCIMIKLPGHCSTPDPDDFSAPTIETELSIINQVTRELTDQPIHLVGHSFGGVVALMLALKGSLNLRKVTLFEPVAVWILELMKNKELHGLVEHFLWKYRLDVSQNLPYACGQVIDFWGGDGAFNTLPDFIKDGMTPLVPNNLRHWDICTTVSHSTEDLQQLNLPIHLVCGSQSNPIAHAICDHLHTAIPGTTKHIIEGASHFLVTTHVTECLSILENPSIIQ